ncbi:unnamed protein product [Cyprideis torosa]|uniref:ABC1 atypical kinase-like domain-containing protein n=1 Tax=Cyprideis torosa TaxID=163714 RepID=A0A7R8WKH8_9CRUS|nr:unnamed protein product [Cyprideis torosa]CAG0897094.1 unnamed protein product [Cyprideis torosa]
MIPDPVSWRHKVKYQLRWMLDKKSDICDTTEELAHEEAPTDEEVIQITEQTKVRVYLRAFLRLLVIIFKFMPAVVTYPMTFLGKEREDQWWDIFISCIENCGPVFIKFGQWIGARCDLFPQACFRMLRLQDRAITHPWEETEQTLRVVFGDKWRDIFEEFEEQPIGSGCVAQVYRARVNNSFLPTRFRHECRRWEIFPDDMPSYTDVAIKVLHPKVKYYFMIDVLLLRIISKGLERFYPWSKDIIPESSINTFETLMAKQSNIPELESWVEMTTPEDASSSPWVHDIVILDSGIVTSFKEEVKESFKACFRTLLTNNGYEFAEIIMDHSKETLSEEAKLTFKEDMADFIDECWHTIEAGGSVMGPMLVQLFERLRFHQIFMDNDFSAIIMSFIIAEGMGRSLHPGPDILSRARPFIHRPDLKSDGLRNSGLDASGAAYSPIPTLPQAIICRGNLT